MTHLFSFYLLVFTAMITPGPNNLLTMYSGLNFGFKRTFPFILGVLFGSGILLFVIGLGLGSLFESLPMLKTIMKVAGSLYILFLALKIALMSDVKGQGRASPISFWAAALFQWVNPKVWIFFLTYVSIFHVTSNIWANTLILVVSIIILNFPCLMIWTFCGKQIQKIMHNKRQVKLLNRLLGLVLAMSVLLLWK
ncbi:MAG: Cysteine/O-acetylserine efflux protein [Chlamydiia bacterium]|nr:Cysteine/O-acetylserine efflux protein [Chlamydiia bacterium]MCH9617897.1 Cysteine/O-acetylserine efflux protein [Chlamydiia bacterium]MCH9624113.1 Cysteine/O-acetylserine efflux protein [Chlamydiia bacterium]